MPDVGGSKFSVDSNADALCKQDVAYNFPKYVECPDLDKCGPTDKLEVTIDDSDPRKVKIPSSFFTKNLYRNDTLTFTIEGLHTPSKFETIWFTVNTFTEADYKIDSYTCIEATFEKAVNNFTI